MEHVRSLTFSCVLSDVVSVLYLIEVADEIEFYVCPEVLERRLGDFEEDGVECSFEFHCEETVKHEQLEPHDILGEPEDPYTVSETLIERSDANQEHHRQDDEDIKNTESDVPRSFCCF